MKNKRLQGCLIWMAILGFVFVVSLSLFFITKPNVAYAVQDLVSMATLFARVEVEIMLPTPYGRYYSELYWKHYEELGQIFRTYPPYREDMYQLMRLYIPNIEATLNGRGDVVQITQEQVDELQSFFDKIWAVASEDLRADIDRELVRTPLQSYVGMSMDETIAYIESAWKRDFVATPMPMDTIMATPVETLVP